MGRARNFLKTWWQAGIAVTAMLTALSAMAIAYPSLKRTQGFARDGKTALDRQCLVYPISRKLYVAAERYHLLTMTDLQTYLSTAPKCGDRPVAKP